ncbi:hypothetical protein GIB67_028021 [Kingdonia uniflora]|uniref:Uncharacterized protein n=1 Tax=Kingdonia uniflora TaxID=39325 RepID=A0A7J7NER2_9MAGN|nr:hypothetical protein GIB67_028021 [Kingdonia uniflora]
MAFLATFETLPLFSHYPFSSPTTLNNPIYYPLSQSLSSKPFLSFPPQPKKQWSPRVSYEVGGGFDESDVRNPQRRGQVGGNGDAPLDPSYYEALLKGGEQVTSVLQEMVKLNEETHEISIPSCAPQLEDMNMDEASEEVAVGLAAQGVIGKRVDQMESGFMMALDYMIQLAEKDDDDQRKSLLEVIKETVLSHLTKKCPPHVQVIGLLCRTPLKESRQELLRRVAAGGGTFRSEKGAKVQLPGANLNDIANQADDLLETMESKPTVPDRKLLARLVLIREEARNMMGGGILDERNNRGLTTLPEAEVNFLTKLVALRPSETVKEMIKNVMQGKDEGAESSSSDEGDTANELSGISGRASVTGRKPHPVRPGMFLETVTKVIIYVHLLDLSSISRHIAILPQLGAGWHLCWKCVGHHSSTSRMGNIFLPSELGFEKPILIEEYYESKKQLKPEAHRATPHVSDSVYTIFAVVLVSWNWCAQKNLKPSSKFVVSFSSEESSSSDRTMDDLEVIGTVTVDKPTVPSERDVGLQAEIETGQFFMYPENVDVAKKFLQYKRSLDGKWGNYVMNAGLWFRTLVRPNGCIWVEHSPHFFFQKGIMNALKSCPGQLNGNVFEIMKVCEALNKRWGDGGIARQFVADDVLKYYKLKYVKDRKSGYLFSDSAMPNSLILNLLGDPGATIL